MQHRAARLALVLAVLVVTSLIVGGARFLNRDTSQARATAVAPSSVPVASAPTVLTTTTTTLAVPAVAMRRGALAVRPKTVLTVPERPPADPYADVPVVRIGTIEIPKIGLSTAVYEGVWLTVIDVGPGHWPGSAMPGAIGNAVIAGHRTTKTHPFLDVDQLLPGDEVRFVMANGTFTYRVTGTQIVTPKDLWVVNQTPDASTMTLIACHPKYSARQRIIVRGTLVES